VGRRAKRGGQVHALLKSIRRPRTGAVWHDCPLRGRGFERPSPPHLITARGIALRFPEEPAAISRAYSVRDKLAPRQLPLPGRVRIARLPLERVFRAVSHRLAERTRPGGLKPLSGGEQQMLAIRACADERAPPPFGCLDEPSPGNHAENSSNEILYTAIDSIRGRGRGHDHSHCRATHRVAWRSPIRSLCAADGTSGPWSGTAADILKRLRRVRCRFNLGLFEEAIRSYQQPDTVAEFSLGGSLENGPAGKPVVKKMS